MKNVSWLTFVVVSGCVSVQDDGGESCGGATCGEGECCVIGCGPITVAACVDPPDACEDVSDPVCGCDGVTYGNPCEARAACVAIDHEGACAGGGECGRETCAEGECCLESCGGMDPADECVEPPDACGEYYFPVCGCDGVTYGNACEAHAACVAVDHGGACDAPACGGDVCGTGECCAESCGGLDAADQCIEPPDACPLDIWDPVCGCDGVTYSYDCEARRACVAIDYRGPCGSPEVCGGEICAEGECCLASCGGVDPADLCAAPADACPAVWAPVCGCNGVTYGNECEAHGSCVAIDHRGECEAVCAYQDPGDDGCPVGTVDCPQGGPSTTCVPPEEFDRCCCELCL